MYHCGVPPVLQHISNGMYGAIIVEPVTPLPKAREYVLVSSELYPADKPVKGVYEGDFTKMLSGNPQYVVFNGVADQYKDAPLVARPNERIRLWVMNAGPTLTNAFHVIGALFDHVYVDGNPTNVMNGVQTWNVAPGGGAMFELTIPDAGLYPFVTHSFAFTGRGAVGVLKVSTEVPAAPPTYPLMGDPFSAGVEPAAAQPQGPATGGSTGGSISGSTGGSTSGGTSGSGAANTFELMIQNVAFDDTDFTVKSDMKDMVALSIMNMDALAHDFTVDALNVKLVVGPDETKTFTFPAKPGIYDFYCSVPGHEQAGMKGTLTVS
jgi:nitrite reductase (NO-forming)